MLQSDWLMRTIRQLVESHLADENTLHLVNFIRGSARGICRE